ncbi:Leu/Phe/Val dehydrogenase [Pseudoblastomonas halimionae]|nr:Glu/Leu/Phe/Val dehydrogenase dimerization domain-containing protein [Alteriqipengyuania halimionae]
MWDLPDYDDHEIVHFIRDIDSGLSAIIALHSTHLGPAGGGTRFWHYADKMGAVKDVLRLSRGMSYKNAMAGLPMGGGKAVILADDSRTKTPEMLEAFGRAVEGLGGKYVTAEDVGISVADMLEVAKQTSYVSGLPAQGDHAGGDPGPFTAFGIFLGIRAAVRHKLDRDSMDGVHVAIQGTGSVGGRLARLLAEDGAKLTLADINDDAANDLAAELGGETASTDEIMGVDCDVFSPNALGGILDDASIAALQAPIVAGGANNQLARPEHGRVLAERDILYAPDYVINAGGIISVAHEYFAKTEGREADVSDVRERIGEIPDRLVSIWEEAKDSGLTSAEVADKRAQTLIGRG